MKTSQQVIDGLLCNVKEFRDLTPHEQEVLEHLGTETCQIWDNVHKKWRKCVTNNFVFNRAYRINDDYADTLTKYIQIEDTYTEGEEEEPQEEIIFCGPATIVQWTDGTKTVVKCSKGDKFNPAFGYLLAYYLKHSGETKTQTSKFFDELREVYAGKGT